MQQAYDFAYNLPAYEGNILDKARWLEGTGDGAWSRATKAIAEVRQKLVLQDVQGQHTLKADEFETSGGIGTADRSPSNVKESARLRPGLGSEAPIQVEVVKRLSSEDVVQSLISPLISPLAMSLTVVILVIFMLLEREDLRNRVIRVTGGTQLGLTTKALDDATRRVSRYLLMQLVTNAIFGFAVAVGLFSIGLPNPILWGTTATFLRFVPMIGPWIAAVMPLAISLAIFDGWSQPMLVLLLFFAAEMISSNVVENILCSTSTGISTVGILAASAFWSWMWGPVGLVLATPLTVCLTVVGRYVPQLAVLNTLIGDEETLPPGARYYQRLISDDIDEALSVADDFLAKHSVRELYDQVLLPALALAEHDSHRSVLEEHKLDFVQQATRNYVDELSLHLAASEASDRRLGKTTILCLPGHHRADEIIVAMLAQLFAAEGIAAEALSIDTLTGEMISFVESKSIKIVCVSGLPPFGTTHSRYLCKRMRARFADLTIAVGLWQSQTVPQEHHSGPDVIGANYIFSTLGDTVDTIKKIALSTSAKLEQAA